MKAIIDAIQEGQLNATVMMVISDQERAPALQTALQAGIQAFHLPYDSSDRRKFEQQAAELIREAECDLVVLAGFMRLLTQWFIEQFRDRIVNIHPSLLPSFKGMDAQGQALAAGVKIAGCTVHLVTEELDSGRILDQASVRVEPDDTESTLSNRILEQEHKLYPKAIGAYLDALNQA